MRAQFLLCRVDRVYSQNEREVAVFARFSATSLSSSPEKMQVSLSKEQSEIERIQE